MSSAIRQAAAPFGWSLALHAALAGILLASLLRTPFEAPLPVVPIDAVIMDQAVLQALARQRSEDNQRRAQQLALQQQAEAQAQEQQRQEELRREQVAADRQAEQQQRLAAEQAAKQKAAADAKRKAEEQAKAAAEARQKKLAADARSKAERESELRARLAEEEQRTSAAFQGLKAQFIAAIQAHVERRWFKPPGARAGATCTVQLTQIPGGEVVGVRFGACDGGEAMRQSIETAVRNASPLPPPPEPALFERELRLVFRPEE